MWYQRVKGKKRQLVELYNDEDDIDKVYKFKVLLPNGTSIGITVIDPGPEMPIGHFVSLVKDEYFRAWKPCEPKRQKRCIDWKGARLYLEDVNCVKFRNTIKFENFKPHRCHILQLHVSTSFIIIHPPICFALELWAP